MQPRLLTSAFLLILFLSAAAHADPVVITGGAVTVTRGPAVTSSVQLGVSGDGFAASGFTTLQRYPLGCNLCVSGQTTAFNESLQFTSTSPFPGGPTSLNGLTVGGTSFDAVGFASFLELNLNTGPVTVVIPPGASTVTFVVPFTATGSYRIDSNSTFQVVGSGTVAGQGLAEVVLRRDGNTSLYVTESITYRFQDPAAVPEPATLALLGLGSGGAWLVKRRRKAGRRAGASGPFGTGAAARGTPFS